MGIGNKILMGRGLTDHRTMGYNIFIEVAENALTVVKVFFSLNL